MFLSADHHDFLKSFENRLQGQFRLSVLSPGILKRIPKMFLSFPECRWLELLPPFPHPGDPPENPSGSHLLLLPFLLPLKFPHFL